MTAEKKLITCNDPKGLQATNLFQGVYNKAGFNDTRAQRLNENRGSKFTDGLMKLVTECSSEDKFIDQVVKSNYTYPNEFHRKSEKLQIETLAGELKDFGIDPIPALEHLNKIGIQSILPSGCHLEDGNYAILSPFGRQKLVSGYDNPFDPDLYCKTLLKLFDIVSRKRNFYNWREGQIDADHLRQLGETIEAYKKIVAIQGKSDIWIISAQLGFFHKGESVNRARELFLSNEFGLDSVSGISIDIVHPEHRVRNEELDSDLPGDEFSSSADGVFSEAPFLFFGHGRLGFGTSDVSFPVRYFGSASFFLPQ